MSLSGDRRPALETRLAPQWRARWHFGQETPPLTVRANRVPQTDCSRSTAPDRASARDDARSTVGIGG